MADGVFNISKGRFGELFNRVDANDPSASVLVVILYKVIEVDDTLNNYTTVSGIAGGTNTEANFTNYARVILTDTNIALGSPDNTNNRFDYDIPDPVWTSAGGATNNTLAKLVIAYDNDSAAGTDANLIPMTYHDFVITTNGGNLTGVVNASGFGRAA
jgi:hypothetical protein